MDPDELYEALQLIVKHDKDRGALALARFLSIKNEYPSLIKYSILVDLARVTKQSFEDLCTDYFLPELPLAEKIKLDTVDVKASSEYMEATMIVTFNLAAFDHLYQIFYEQYT